MFDNSHLQGTNQLGGMIVAGPEGFMKNQYRKFNIKDETTRPGDDYAMMREVFTRRYGRLAREENRGSSAWPDLVLVDGGRGQLNIAHEVMVELGLEDVPLVGIAKEPDRDAGREHFFMHGKSDFMMPPNRRCFIICSACVMRRTASPLAVIGRGAALIFEKIRSMPLTVSAP